MANTCCAARQALIIILILTIGIFSVVLAAEGKKKEGAEKKIAKTELPSPILTAFEKAYPAAKITGTSVETEDSTTYFEIESRDGKIKRDILYTADGAVKEIEEGVTKEDLPTAIKEAIAKQYPNGKIRKGEKTTRDNTVEYELIVKNGKDKLEVVLDETGRIIKTEKIVAKEKDEEKEEKQQGKK